MHAFLTFRTDSITEFFGQIRSAVKAVRPRVDMRLNHYAAYPELMGLPVRPCEYTMRGSAIGPGLLGSGSPGLSVEAYSLAEMICGSAPGFCMWGITSPVPGSK